MKHIGHFDHFMTSAVNLGKLRLELLEERVDDIYAAIKADSVTGDDILNLMRQGSWAQKTIIEPQNDKDYDADVMVQLRYRPEWDDDPRKYPNALYNAVDAAPSLSWREFERHARCVRVHYDEMHVDLVPYVIQPDGTMYIIDRDKNVFEATDPAKFTTWMRGKDDLANKNLRKVIRIVKYLRAHNNTFTGTPSIIITTLLGERVTAKAKTGDPSAYADLPTALLKIVTDLNDWLDPLTSRPKVMDPSGTGFDFTHRWEPESFAYFKSRMAAHGQQIQDAYYETDPVRSVELWQGIFGDDFCASPTSNGGKFGGGAGGAGGVGVGTTTGRSGRAG